MAISNTALFPGLTVANDGSSFTVPISALSGLTAAELQGSDGRKLAYAIISQMHEVMADDPSVSTMFSMVDTDPIAISPSQVQKSYTATFTLNFAVTDISDEESV